MKKIKFLCCTALVAFMAFGLASCEKENFNTENNVTVTPPTIIIPGIEIPERYEPGDAIIAIQPKVNAFINGSIINVTEDAIIKINGETKKHEVLTGKTIAAQDVKIEVSYTAVIDGFEKELTATDNISIPAMQAGMVAIINPTIWLSINGESSIYSEVEIGDEIWDNYSVTLTNNSDYWYSDATAELEYIVPGCYVTKSEIEEAYQSDEEVKEIIDSYTEGLGTELKKQTLKLENVVVYAQSLTIIPYSQSRKSVEYTFFKSMDWSRAAETIKVASINTEEYFEIAFNANDIKTNINLQGEGHGHGHGHGHGSGNAGSGIGENVGE